MLFYLVSSFAMNEETKNQWLQFSSAVSLNKKNCNILLKIILFLLKNNLLIPWLNTHFIEKKSLAEMSKDIINIQKDLESFKLDDVLLTIQRWELLIPQWANIHKFDALIEQYQKDMLEALENLDFMRFGAIEVDKEPKNLEEAQMMLKPYINGLIKTPESVFYVTTHLIKKQSIDFFIEQINFQKSSSSFHFDKTSHLTELVPFHKTESRLNQEALCYLLYNSIYSPNFIFDYSTIKPQADFTKLNVLTQQTLLNTILKLCHVMDSTIKSLKGSLSYNNARNLQILRFYQLLEIFLLPMNYCLIGLGQHPFVSNITQKFLEQ